jgi:hypothetical protein
MRIAVQEPVPAKALEASTGHANKASVATRERVSQTSLSSGAVKPQPPEPEAATELDCGLLEHADIHSNAMQDSSINALDEGSSLEVSDGSEGRSGSGDFELWVETDINAAWCLEDNSGSTSQWRDACQTSILRRRWEEFEALGQQVISGSSELSYSEALELLGLSEGVNPAQVASAFRQQSRSCHPDKVPASDLAASAKFAELSAAYEMVQKSLSSKSSLSAGRAIG